MTEEHVILVDEQDRELGMAEKMDAHRKGLLHRAISVVLFQKENPNLVLLQQRAAGKYHSPLMWANACCSHPRHGELPAAAASRRLYEELGIDVEVESLIPAGTFIYRAELGDLIEHELDHVFIGFIENQDIPFNPAEVAAVEWVDTKDILKNIADSSFRKYVPWLEKVLYKALEVHPHSLNKVSA